MVCYFCVDSGGAYLWYPICLKGCICQQKKFSAINSVENRRGMIEALTRKCSVHLYSCCSKNNHSGWRDTSGMRPNLCQQHDTCLSP